MRNRNIAAATVIFLNKYIGKRLRRFNSFNRSLDCTLRIESDRILQCIFTLACKNITHLLSKQLLLSGRSATKQIAEIE